MGFKAEGLVQPLDWDFKPYIDASGVIDEPMDKELSEFSDAWRKEIIESAKDVGANPKDLEDMGREEILKILEAIDPEKQKATARRQAEIFSRLCSGHPTTAQLMKLPPRVRGRFYRWLNSEVVSPEAEPGAGNGQVIQLPSAAAG